MGAEPVANGSAASTSASAPKNKKCRVTSYSIRLPHNSVLVMWEGFQEFWRHEVPKDQSLKPHEISGDGRLSFTFRKRNFTVSNRAPNCFCTGPKGGKRRAMLKPVFKIGPNLGRYFWSCTNPRVGGKGAGATSSAKVDSAGKGDSGSSVKIQTSSTSTYSTCEFFKWDDVLLEEMEVEKRKAKQK